MTRLIPWAALAVIVFSLTACGGGNSPELRRVEEGKSITVLRSDKSPNLDPQSSSSGGDVRVLSLMYEHLVSASVGTDEVEWEKNGLAESWSINDNDHSVPCHNARSATAIRA
jgi:ABC-type transport system substrate-binding protein